MTEIVSIIIPTFNNYDYLSSCLRSLLGYSFTPGLFKVYVINNGHPDSCNFIQSESNAIEVINTGRNLGWEGGLLEGMKHVKGEFILFLNDDTYFPMSSSLWLTKLLNHFHNPKVGAVGPSSNVVMGSQNIFQYEVLPIKKVNYLIGFCMLVRRSALDTVGGIDESLPGGDDLDLSIRLRKADFGLLVDRSVFVYHHGFKTGERVHGTPDKAGGWNSWSFKEKVDGALIRKHGFRAWFETLFKTPEQIFSQEDAEGNIIRNEDYKGIILDLGCGGRKTYENSIGVDFIAKDEVIDTLHGTKSVADVVADIMRPLPFENDYADVIIARHILEHTLDPIKVVRQWMDKIKPAGYLVIAVPDETKINSIPMNIEHKHAFTPDSLTSVIQANGGVVEKVIDPGNGVSFILFATKI